MTPTTEPTQAIESNLPETEQILHLLLISDRPMTLRESYIINMEMTRAIVVRPAKTNLPLTT